MTRESEDQMADLAGNAMTSTVVGSAIVAALVTNANAVREAPWAGSYKEAQEWKRNRLVARETGIFYISKC